jgi:hypothetical protein
MSPEPRTSDGIPVLASEIRQHIADVADLLLRGKVVFFLGAGINLCERPLGFSYTYREVTQLPSGGELAEYLAQQFRYPTAPICTQVVCEVRGAIQSDLDLSKVAQYGATIRGPGALYEELRYIFTRDYPVTAAHLFLASLAFRAPRALKPEDSYPLIVTTNYDKLLEKALGRTEFDLIYYDASSGMRGQFRHQKPSGETVLIERELANDYDYPFLESRPAILKMHGEIHGSDDLEQSVVITEDDYIDYLASEALDKFLPPRLLGKLRRNHLLFLGYSLRDWNLRVFLRRVKRSRANDFTCWAVVLHSTESERQYWRETARVEIKELEVLAYLRGLRDELVSREGVPALIADLKARL